MVFLPGSSPDLNFIEHMWDMMNKGQRKVPNRFMAFLRLVEIYNAIT